MASIGLKSPVQLNDLNTSTTLHSKVVVGASGAITSQTGTSLLVTKESGAGLYTVSVVGGSFSEIWDLSVVAKLATPDDVAICITTEVTGVSVTFQIFVGGTAANVASGDTLWITLEGSGLGY